MMTLIASLLHSLSPVHYDLVPLFQLVCMGVVMCQCAAGMMLYRLLISRSLYWEVSSLSSYLPLRMDKTFGAKLYS